VECVWGGFCKKPFGVFFCLFCFFFFLLLFFFFFFFFFFLFFFFFWFFFFFFGHTRQHAHLHSFLSLRGRCPFFSHLVYSILNIFFSPLLEIRSASAMEKYMWSESLVFWLAALLLGGEGDEILSHLSPFPGEVTIHFADIPLFRRTTSSLCTSDDYVTNTCNSLLFPDISPAWFTSTRNTISLSKFPSPGGPFFLSPFSSIKNHFFSPAPLS